VRRLVLHLRNADGTIASGAVLRCGSHIDAANDRDGELVLDPAPELPVQIARDYAGPWSEPVSMPRDRREHTATVVVPAK
jgi:hypothetical protein